MGSAHCYNPHLSKWDVRFMLLAEHISAWSKDPSTQVGCVIAIGNKILGTGFNGLPPYLEDNSEILEDRETKYKLVVHAEINAINDAKLKSPDLSDSTIYISFPTCSNCAETLVSEGIKRVVMPNPSLGPERWVDNFKAAEERLCSKGAQILYFLTQ